MHVWCGYVSMGLPIEVKHNFLKSVLSISFNIGFRNQTRFTRSVQQPSGRPLHFKRQQVSHSTPQNFAKINTAFWIKFPQILMQESRIQHDYEGTQGWLGTVSVSTSKEGSQSSPKHHSAMWYPKLSGCLAYCLSSVKLCHEGGAVIPPRGKKSSRGDFILIE